MAILFMESFDHYATADVPDKWTVTAVGGTSATTAITAAAGRRSSSAWRWVTGTSTTLAALGYLQKTLAPADATAILGFALAMSGNPAGTNGVQLATIRHGASPQVTLRLNSDGTLSVLRGTVTGTLLGTTSATVSVGSFVHLEWKVLIGSSGGTVDLRINGASVLSLAGQNTQNTVSAIWTSVSLGHLDGQTSATNGVSANVDFDDVYVLDGSGPAPWQTFLGDCRVDYCAPTGAGAVTQWTPSTGANWQCVDDSAPNDDTDYTSSGVVTDVDTFVLQDAPAPGTILGVQVLLNMKKVSAGACSVAPVVRQSGTNYAGSDLNPGTTYAYSAQIFPTNPDTAAAWSIAAFNAAEFGYARTA